MHGPHQVAQKSTTTILPRRLVRLMGVPSAAWKESTGLSPTSTAPRAMGLMQERTASTTSSFFMAMTRLGEMSSTESLNLRSLRRNEVREGSGVIVGPAVPDKSCPAQPDLRG